MMVGISLFATLLSTLSYLSYPGEMVKYGPVVFIGLAAFPVAYYIVSRLMIPRYMKMNVTSAYEILRDQAGARCAFFGDGLFPVAALPVDGDDHLCDGRCRADSRVSASIRAGCLPSASCWSLLP
ncbi:MAG: hypothetical protein ACLR8Y_08430 [Alistipes indistinctus]